MSECVNYQLCCALCDEMSYCFDAIQQRWEVILTEWANFLLIVIYYEVKVCCLPFYANFLSFEFKVHFEMDFTLNTISSGMDFLAAFSFYIWLLLFFIVLIVSAHWWCYLVLGLFNHLFSPIRFYRFYCVRFTCKKQCCTFHHRRRSELNNSCVLCSTLPFNFHFQGFRSFWFSSDRSSLTVG